MAKKKAVKNVEIQEVVKSLSGQGLKVLFSFARLNVADAQALKKKFRDNGFGFKVVKKTLLARALHEKGFEADKVETLTNDLKDTSAVGWGSDELGPTKVLYEFGRTNPSVKMKTGFLENSLFDAIELLQLAKTSGRIELYGSLVSVMVGPMRNFVGVLQGVPRQFVQVLSAMREKKS